MSSPDRDLPATLTLSLSRRGAAGVLVVEVPGDDLVRAWVTFSDDPRTDETVEGLFIPLEIEREWSLGEAESFGVSREGAPLEPWPEREETHGRLGCLFVATSVVFALLVLYAAASWLLAG